MNILSDRYFDAYKKQLTIDISSAMKGIDEIEMTAQTFTFYTSVAVISSSRIEGEQLEIDSYVKHKMQNVEYLPELTEKPNDLYKAYLFAKQNKLSSGNFLQSHALLSQHLLPDQWRGVYRKNELVVLEHQTGKIQFEAAPFSMGEKEMDELWADISVLLQQKLTLDELFYYAAFIHASFVAIHPFNDGNGRAARLLEKWFLAAYLEEKA